MPSRFRDRIGVCLPRLARKCSIGVSIARCLDLSHFYVDEGAPDSRVIGVVLPDSKTRSKEIE